MIEIPTLIKTDQTGSGYRFLMSQVNSSILPKDIDHGLHLHPPHLVPALACAISVYESTRQPDIHSTQKKKKKTTYAKLNQLNQLAAGSGRQHAERRGRE